MRIIPPSDWRRMPWKNSGGATAEIAVFPAGADFADMDWRLSLATMTADAPFSAFPGFDRTLAVVAGALTLDVSGTRVDLAACSAPHRFAGDAPVTGLVREGPVMNLNMMTRLGRVDHDMRRVMLRGQETLSASAVFCAAGRVQVESEGERAALEVQHTVLTDGEPVTLTPEGPAVVYLVTLTAR